jgi:hypothetical protein
MKNKPLHNSKKYPNSRFDFIIKPEGSIDGAMRLDVPNKFRRENIIFLNFMYYIMRMIGHIVKFDIVSRDNPWDFEIKTSNFGSFYVEITSISDSSDLFRQYSQYESFSNITRIKKVRLRDLHKALKNVNVHISENFPIRNIDKIGNDKFIENPLYNVTFSPEFCSYIPYDPPLSSILRILNQKASKFDRSFDKTIVLIDNRYSHLDHSLIMESINSELSKIISLPFKGVYLYTGRFSSDCGSYSDFFISPLKAEIIGLPNDKLDDNGEGLYSIPHLSKKMQKDIYLYLKSKAAEINILLNNADKKLQPSSKDNAL